MQVQMHIGMLAMHEQKARMAFVELYLQNDLPDLTICTSLAVQQYAAH